MNLDNVDEKLIELLFYGLEYGIDSVKASNTPLITFIVSESECKRTLSRMLTPRIEDGPEKARSLLRDGTVKADFAVIAYDGYLTLDNKRYDAIFVEGYDKKDRMSYTFARRYKPKRFLFGLREIGNPAFVATGESIL